MAVAQRARPDFLALRELGGQALMIAGVLGGALTIVDFWLPSVSSAAWLQWIAHRYSAGMKAAFSLVFSPLAIGISKEGYDTLSFLLFYGCLTVGAILIENKSGSLAPKLYKLGQIFIVAYIIWPVMFLVSFALGLLAFADKSYSIIMFLCAIALCHLFINNLVRVDAETLGLLLLLFICNLEALNKIRDVIFGVHFAVGNSYKRALIEIVLTLLIVMILFFPAVLAPRNVFRKGLGFLIIGAITTFGISAISQVNVSQLSPSKLTHCCTLRAPWSKPAQDAEEPKDQSLQNDARQNLEQVQ